MATTETDRFVFLKDWLTIVECYNNDMQLVLLKSILELGFNPDLKIDTYPNEIRPPLILIKESILRMQKKYANKSKAGKRGMRNRWFKDWDYFIDSWNKLNLSQIEITDERKELITNWLKTYEKEDFEKVCEMIQKSDFLKGKNERNWTINFDFALTPDNTQKILDGNYNNNSSSNDKISKIWQ